MRKPFRGFLERYWKVSRRSAQGHGSVFSLPSAGRVRGAGMFAEGRLGPNSPVAQCRAMGMAWDGATGVSQQPDRRQCLQQWPLPTKSLGCLHPSLSRACCLPHSPCAWGPQARCGIAQIADLHGHPSVAAGIPETQG